VHTYAFQLRDVCAYIGVESPEKRCGKTTLLSILSALVHRPVVAANISPPAFFRVIEELQPTLMIDEADTFLQGNDELRGIFNAGYNRQTAYVVRLLNKPSKRDSASNSESRITHHESRITPPQSGITHHASHLARFSCWCPKVIAAIGRLPDTLADRCIIIRMQRKTAHEQCERLKFLKTSHLQRQCLRFVLDHEPQIATAQPEIPPGLTDRAADIWEPLLILADLAGGDWPNLARQAATTLTAAAQDIAPISSLLLDIFVLFLENKADRLFTRALVEGLNRFTNRPWLEMTRGKPVTDQWLSQKLRPYGVRPRSVRLDGLQAKGYFQEDFMDIFRRYIAKSDFDALIAESKSRDRTESIDLTPTPTT
jgi:hypothetical protein